MPKAWPPSPRSARQGSQGVDALPATPIRSAPVIRIFAATPFYLQGVGALAHVGAVAARHGRKPGLIIDARVRPLVGDAIRASFAVPPREVAFAGEVTDGNIALLSQEMAGCEVIIGVGGGKALDAAKGVALRIGSPFLSVPTIASNDGPASRGIAIYDDTHQLVRVDQLPSNPVAVIVDSAIIARAPPHFLRAGIGDAIAKTFEAQACARTATRTKQGTTATHAALAIADAAYRLLRTHAEAALASVNRGEHSEALEATIEACILLSALGFENGGLSIAHSVTRGLLRLDGAKERLHGEHVAYGVLVQLVVERRPNATLVEMAAFLTRIGLPISLADLGVRAVTPELIETTAAVILSSPHVRATDRHLTQGDIAAAIRFVETLPARAPRAPESGVTYVISHGAGWTPPRVCPTPGARSG
ncbi:glycerol dehydrogenase [Sphingomonas sp. TDK1]|uniref:glycerol dehydrogenase n=1 Tax=Sphingomonas sp. TDK1 TaxID=453247 RepID=UPI000A05D7F4|nr:glycerol dehydrogenase [Sphingomonas sp. TDK1]